MAIRSDLELDVTSALDAVEEVKSALEEAFTKAVEAFTDAIEGGVQQAISSVTSAVIEVDADTSSAEQDLDRVTAPVETTVTVDADTTSAESTVQDFTAGIDTIVIPVEPDTTDLVTDIEAAVSGIDPVELEIEGGTEGLDDATDSTEDLSAGFEGLANAAGSAVGVFGALEGASNSLSIAQTVAGGGVKSLASAIGGISPQAAGAVGGLSAAAAAIGFLVTKAEPLAAAQERLTNTFGDQAKAIQEIDVGGLTGDMRELATESGNSDTQLLQSISTLGALAKVSGFTAAQTDKMTGNFAALALRATAMNPQLGEAGRVVTQLQTMLARGGPRLSRFGISLTSAEIVARALSDSGKTLSKDLTILERSAAGAALAVEKLGPTVGTDFAKGIDTSAVRFKVLQREIASAIAEAGLPLVEPVLEILEAFLPVATATAVALGALAKAVIQVTVPIAKALVPAVAGLAVAAKGVAPVVGFIAEQIEKIPAPIVLAAAAIALLTPAMDALALGLYAIAGAVDAVTAAVIANPIVALAVALTAVGIAIGVLPSSLLAVAAAVAVVSSALVVAQGEVLTLAAVMDIALGPIGLIIAAIGVFLVAVGAFDKPVKEAKLNVEGLTEALFGGAEGISALDAAVRSMTPELTEFARTEAAASDDADSIKQVMESLGITFNQIAQAIQLSDDAFFSYMQNLSDMGAAAGLSSEQVEDLSRFIETQRRTLTASAAAQLDELASTGAITQAQLDQIKARRDLNAATAGSIDSLGNYTLALQDATAAALSNTEQSFANAEAWILLGEAIARGEVAAEDFPAIADRFGVAQSVIEDFAKASTKAILDFVNTVVSKLPETTAITEAFVSGSRTAFKAVQDSSKSLTDAQNKFREATGRGLDSQRRGVRDAAEALDDARNELSKAAAERARAGFESETQEQIAKEIERTDEALANATEGVSDATVRFNDAQASLAQASADARAQLAESQQELADAQNDLVQALDPARIIEQIQKQIDALRNFSANVAELIKRGQGRAAEEALKLGPDIGAAFAQGLVDASPEVAAGVDEALQLEDSAKEDFKHDVEDFAKEIGPVGGDAAKAFADQYGITLETDLPENSASALAAVEKVFGEASPRFQLLAAQLGVDVSKGYAAALSLVSPTKLAVENWANELQQVNPELDRATAEILANQDAAFISKFGKFTPKPGDVGGFLKQFLGQFLDIDAATASDVEAAGANVGQGIITGFGSKEEDAQTRGREFVRAMLEAVNDEAQNESPSKLFQKPGEDMAAGIGVGLGEGKEIVVLAAAEMISSAATIIGLLAAAGGVELGHKLREGFALGMIDDLTVVELNARIMTLNAEKAAADELKTGSPSKVFIELGHQIPAGLAIGIEEESAQVTDAAAAMFTDFQGAVVGDQTVSVPVTFTATDADLAEAVAGAEGTTAEIPTVMLAPDTSAIPTVVADVERTTATIATAIVPPADLAVVDDTISSIEILTATIDLTIAADTADAGTSIERLAAAVGDQTITLPVALGAPDTTAATDGVAAVEAVTAEVPVRLVAPFGADVAADDLVTAAGGREATVAVSMAPTSPTLADDVTGSLVADVETQTATVTVGLAVADDAEATVTAAVASAEAQTATITVGFADPDLTPVTSAVNAAEARSAEITLGVAAGPVSATVANVIASAEAQSATIPVEFGTPDPAGVLAATADAADRQVEIPFSIVPAAGATDALQAAVGGAEDLSVEIPVRTVLADDATNAAFALVAEAEAQDTTLVLGVVLDPLALPTIDGAVEAVKARVDRIEFAPAEIPVTTTLAPGAIDAAANLASEAEAQDSTIDLSAQVTPESALSVQESIAAIQATVGALRLGVLPPDAEELAAATVDAPDAEFRIGVAVPDPLAIADVLDVIAATPATVPIEFDVPDPESVLDDIEVQGAVIQLRVRAPDPEELAAVLADIEAQTATVTATLAPTTGIQQVVQVTPPPAPVATVQPLEVDTANVVAVPPAGAGLTGTNDAQALIDQLTILAGVLEAAVLASRPIEQTFTQEIDPLEAAAQTVWQLTRR